MFEPIKVIDIELSHPLKTIEGLDGYTVLKGLIRLHGSPLGYIRMPVVGGKCLAKDLLRTVLNAYCLEIIYHLLRDWLIVRPRCHGLNIGDLLQVPHPDLNNRRLPLVTVAVCTRDRTDYLSDCLNGLNCLDYPNLDILVVDNAPATGATEQMVRSYQKVRYALESRPGISWARNLAIQEAKGEIIAFTDDDVVVDSRWIRAITDVFIENQEVMGVTGLVVPYELETEAQYLFEKYDGFGRGYERKWSRVCNKNSKTVAIFHGGTGKFGTGANMAFRRKLFEQIGYFDPALGVGTLTMGADDLEMFFRVLKEGHTLVYEPNAIVRHRHRREYAQLRAQISSWGIASTAYLVRSALAYPEECVALAMQWFGRLFCRNLPRLLGSFLLPTRYIRDLTLAELRGSFTGLDRYQKAQSVLQEIDNTFGAFEQAFKTNPAESGKNNSSGRKIPFTPTVELNQPLKALNAAQDFPASRIKVKYNNQFIGKVYIHNHYSPIGVTRLSEAIAVNLGLKLLKRYHNQSFDSLRANLLTALTRYYMKRIKC